LRSYVGLIAAETNEFLHSKLSINQNGIVDVPKAMAELTLYTASRSLQGKEVRAGMDGTFAELFHDLDMGFTPLNFLFPWAPLPQNRRRDRAQQKMTQTYLAIINTRRQSGTTSQTDMITNLMDSTYKDGTPLTDEDVAHIMIALLMAGQHSSSASISWILLRLATRPDTVSALYDEQQRVLGDDKLEYEHLSSLSLHAQVVKETLRLHSPIHSLMRLVKSPMIVHGTPYILPESRVLLAAPGFCAQSSTFFPQPDLWEPRRWDQNNVDFAHLWAAKATMDTDDQVTDYGYGMVSKGAKSPYLPFGAGRHRCIGEQFAYVQLQTILASIVSTFSLARVGQDKAELSTDYSVGQLYKPKSSIHQSLTSSQSLFSKPLAPATVRFIPRTARCD
jgi:cytochrome P450